MGLLYAQATKHQFSDAKSTRMLGVALVGKQMPAMWKAM
jgi:hypothetical protein